MRISPHPALPVIALSAGLVLAGCANTNSRAPTPAPTVSAVAGPLATAQARARFHILVGTMAADHRQPKRAAEQFLAATREVPDSSLAAQAAALAVIAHDDALALAATQELANQKPNDPRALGALLELAVRNDKADTAFAAGQKLLKHSPHGLADTYHGIAEILSQPAVLTHAKIAAQVMQRLVTLHDDQSAAHYASSLLALRQHDADTATAEAKRAVKLAPGDANATMLLIAVLVQQGQLSKARQTLATLVARTHDQPTQKLRFGYAQILFKYGRYQHARTVLLAVLDHDHDTKNTDALLLLSEADLRLNRLDEATATLGHIPKGDAKRDALVQYYLGRIAETRRDYPSALAHYKRAAGGSMGMAAGLQQARVLSLMHKPQQANETLAVLAQTHPNHVEEIIAAQSQILLEAGKQKQALAVIDQALNSLPNSAGLIYQRALIYDQSGRVHDAETALRQLVAKHPHDPRYLNGLGFVLAEHNAPDQLAEAHRLIAKALRMNPDNPAVIDSMGWVLFRQGHARKALPYLHRAYTLFNDPEIAAHLATVLGATGDEDAAQRTLQKALARNPGNKALEKAAQALKP